MDNNSLVKKNLETTLALGGLDDLMKATDTPMLLLDTSGSMAGSPVEQLRKVVAEILKEGTVPMIAFGGPFDAQVRFVDRVPEPDGGTPLHLAIPFAKEYGATRLVVITDGLPDLGEASLEAARAFGGKIDVVYVGDEARGKTFLAELARITGGRWLKGNLSEIKKLSSTVIGLLEGEVAPARGPIQGPGFSAAEPVEPEEVDDEDDDEEDDEEDDDEEDDDDDEA